MTVMTVLGPIADSALGHVQAHEHVFLDLGRAPYRWDYEGLLDDPAVAVEELSAYRAAGGTTLCELTTPDLGRNPTALRDAALASAVNLVMGCGWYRGPYYEPGMDRRSTSELADSLVDEIEQGVGDSGIRPGLIGEIGSDKAWLSGLEERAFRASARAQARTGLALMTHTPPGGAAVQLEILAEAGADLRRVAIGHSDALLDGAITRRSGRPARGCRSISSARPLIPTSVGRATWSSCWRPATSSTSCCPPTSATARASGRGAVRATHSCSSDSCPG